MTRLLLTALLVMIIADAHAQTQTSVNGIPIPFAQQYGGTGCQDSYCLANRVGTTENVTFAGTLAITGAVSNGIPNLVRLTVPTTNMVSGALYTIASVGGVSAANGEFRLTVVDSTHADEVGSSFSGVYTSGGTVTPAAGATTMLWSPSPCGDGTINLPASPLDNEPHNVVNAGVCPSNALTIAGNGHNIGLASSIVSVTAGGTLLRYSSGAGAWEIGGAAGVVAAPGFAPLAVANNLSDVASVATARTNLGLGTGNSPTFAGLTIVGASGAQPFNVSGNGSGAPPAGSAFIFGASESYTAGSAFYIPFFLQDIMTAGGTGHRQAAQITMQTGFGAAAHFYVGLNSLAHLTGGSGSAQGSNPYVWIDNGVMAGTEATGEEVDTDIRSTTNVVRKTGLQIVDVATSIGTGSTYDAGLLIGTQNGGVGYLNGIQIGTATAGTFGVKSTGTLIKTVGTYTFASGIDFSASTFSGNSLALPSLTINGASGALTNTYTAGAGNTLDWNITNLSDGQTGIELTGNGKGWLISKRAVAASDSLQIYACTATCPGGSYSLVATLFPDGGMTLGSPTGGDKGAGTLNVAGGVFLNGTAYTNP